MEASTDHGSQFHFKGSKRARNHCTAHSYNIFTGHGVSSCPEDERITAYVKQFHAYKSTTLKPGTITSRKGIAGCNLRKVASLRSRLYLPIKSGLVSRIMAWYLQSCSFFGWLASVASRSTVQVDNREQPWLSTCGVFTRSNLHA